MTTPPDPTPPDPTPDEYGARYWGWEPAPTSNYRRYGPEAEPAWSKPLARFLVRYTDPPWLDVGCAFGHLVRDLNALAPGARRFDGNAHVAVGIDFSEWAIARRVTEAVGFGDMRHLRPRYAPASFGTVIALDSIEHVEPDQGREVMRQMGEIVRPGGLILLLVGSPDNDPLHYEDLTHRNHQTWEWYVDQARSLRWTGDFDIGEALRHNPNLPDSWRRRWLAVRPDMPQRSAR